VETASAQYFVEGSVAGGFMNKAVVLKVGLKVPIYKFPS